MKFLQVNSNTLVRKSEIIAVEKTEEGLARVVLNLSSYTSEFPYETMLQLLEMPTDEEKKQDKMTLREAFHKPQQYLVH